MWVDKATFRRAADRADDIAASTDEENWTIPKRRSIARLMMEWFF
jgi:hypothetical protein